MKRHADHCDDDRERHPSTHGVLLLSNRGISPRTSSDEAVSHVLVHDAVRGRTRTVAARARAPTIGDRYGLPPYFARYASSIRSLMAPSTGSNTTSFVMPAARMRP